VDKRRVFNQENGGFSFPIFVSRIVSLDVFVSQKASPAGLRLLKAIFFFYSQAPEAFCLIVPDHIVHNFLKCSPLRLSLTLEYVAVKYHWMYTKRRVKYGY